MISAYPRLGEPILPVYAADPHAYQSGDRYFIASTNAGMYRSAEAFDAGEAGEAGHGFAIWSSRDFRTWRNEGPVLRFSDVAWARDLDRAWAPCTVQRNGYTYFYYCAADRIGVAVGDNPAGPFRDVLGAPLIARRADLSAIDPMVFVDENGQAYLFWGAVPAAWLHGEVEPILSHLSVQRLGSDMITLQGPEIPTLQTPPDEFGHHGYGPHMEASHVIRRDGPDGKPLYYLMYSQGSWGHNEEQFLYHVRYATAHHPLGPWTKQPNIVLSTRRDLGRIGPGHHSTLQMAGTDDWYTVYHAHAGDCERRLYVDRMLFDPSGNILPISIQVEGGTPPPIALALQLEEKGPFKNSRPITFRILSQRTFVTIEFFANGTPIGTCDGNQSHFTWTRPSAQFHRVWARGTTVGGKKIQSGDIDLDCL